MTLSQAVVAFTKRLHCWHSFMAIIPQQFCSMSRTLTFMSISQREILDYFKRKSLERRVQFLIATHAEELARGVDATQIVSLLSGTPKRIQSTPALLRAMADVANEEITRLQASPYVLYVEGRK
jgi:hypothetical protein